MICVNPQPVTLLADPTDLFRVLHLSSGLVPRSTVPWLLGKPKVREDQDQVPN